MSVRRWVRTPKGLLTILLVILVAVAAPHEGLSIVALGLLSSVLVAGVIDAGSGVLRGVSEEFAVASGGDDDVVGRALLVVEGADVRGCGDVFNSD